MATVDRRQHASVSRLPSWLSLDLDELVFAELAAAIANLSGANFPSGFPAL
jgi:hypothetical protein